MSMIRFHYDPLTEFERLFDDAFSSRFYRPVAPTTTETRRDLFRPRMDVHENAETNMVTTTFDLAGVKPEEVTIDVNQDRLTVSGETRTREEHDERGYTVRERSWGKFSRTLMLPAGTKSEDVHAKMENGLLNVTFPKELQHQPKRIAIE